MYLVRQQLDAHSLLSLIQQRELYLVKHIKLLLMITHHQRLLIGEQLHSQLQCLRIGATSLIKSYVHKDSSDLIERMVLLLNSNLIGLDVVDLDCLVWQCYLYSLMNTVLVSYQKLVVLPRPTSVYFNLLVVYSESIVRQNTVLELRQKVLVHLEKSVVLLNLLHSIQLRHKCYSPLLEDIQVLHLLMVHGLDLEDLETSLLLKQRKEHLIMLVLVRLILDQMNQMRSTQKIITSVHSYHQLILIMD